MGIIDSHIRYSMYIKDYQYTITIGNKSTKRLNSNGAKYN